MIGLLAQGLARFFYTVLIGRLAGPEVLGQVNTVLSLAVYLSLFWPAALGVAGSRFIPSALHGGARLPDTIRTLTRSFWLSLPVVAGGGVAIAWIITTDAGVALAAGILVATYSGYTFVRGVMLGRDQVVRVGVVDVVSSLAALGLLVAVISTGSTPLLLLPLSAGYLAFSIIGWPRVPRPDGRPTDRDPAIRHFTAHTIVWLVATGGLLPTTMVFAQAFGSPRDAGIFAAAMTLATPANMIAQALSQVLVPHIAGLGASGGDLRAAIRRLYLLTLAGFTVVFGALFALTPVLLAVFYGEQYVEGAPAMYGLLAGVYLSSCATVPISALMATGRQRAVSTVSVVAVVGGTALMAALAPLVGITGVLIGFGLASLTISVWLAVIVLTRPIREEVA